MPIDIYHKQIFQETVKDLTPQSILDAGSGHTSLAILCDMFPNVKIDAVIFPGDERKKQSVGRVGTQCSFNLIEADIAKMIFEKTYDLIIAHLLLGEATMWGNDVSTLLKKLLRATKRYIMVADFPQDPGIDFELIEKLATENGFKISRTTIVQRNTPFVGKEFRGDFYKAILFEKI